MYHIWVCILKTKFNYLLPGAHHGLLLLPDHEDVSSGVEIFGITFLDFQLLGRFWDFRLFHLQCFLPTKPYVNFIFLELLKFLQPTEPEVQTETELIHKRSCSFHKYCDESSIINKNVATNWIVFCENEWMFSLKEMLAGRPLNKYHCREHSAWLRKYVMNKKVAFRRPFEFIF